MWAYLQDNHRVSQLCLSPWLIRVTRETGQGELPETYTSVPAFCERGVHMARAVPPMGGTKYSVLPCFGGRLPALTVSSEFEQGHREGKPKRDGLQLHLQYKEWISTIWLPTISSAL